jgi:hypothetical protein
MKIHKLEPMKVRGMMDNGSNSIRSWEDTLTHLKDLETESTSVQRVELKLTLAIVSMAMKQVDNKLMLMGACLSRDWAIIHSCMIGTANIMSCCSIGPINIEHPICCCKHIFCTRKKLDIKSWIKSRDLQLPTLLHLNDGLDHTVATCTYEYAGLLEDFNGAVGNCICCLPIISANGLCSISWSRVFSDSLGPWVESNIILESINFGSRNQIWWSKDVLIRMPRTINTFEWVVAVNTVYPPRK